MITKFKNYLIKESPDTIYVDGATEYYCQDDEAVPFYSEVNSDHTAATEVYVGSFGGYHSSVQAPWGVDKAYPGRLWTESKIMSFWVYPNKALFKSIMSQLEDALDLKIFNNGWKIEVIKNNDEIKMKEFDTDEDDYYSSTSRAGQNVLIPIEEYAGSEDVSEEEQIMHLMNWKEKDLAMKAGKFHFKSFGSYKTGWDQPRNIKYRQALYQENKNN